MNWTQYLSPVPNVYLFTVVRLTIMSVSSNPTPILL